MVGSVRVVSAEIQRAGRYLITQRSSKAILPLLWEFPGGRVRADETDEAALRRCLLDRIGVQPQIDVQLMSVAHDYGSYQVELVVYRCFLTDEEPWAANVAALAWVSPDEFADYPFPGADQRTVELLLGDST